MQADGVMTLKTTHSYFYQVQAQISVAGYIQHGQRACLKNPKNTVLYLAPQNCFLACPEGCSTRGKF